VAANSQEIWQVSKTCQKLCNLVTKPF